MATNHEERSILIREHHPPQFGFRSVRLYPNDCLGSGAYGVVCKAMCDELPCAAKVLHTTFFQFNDPAMPAMTRRFRRECELMDRIRHPCVVQYLGTVQDPESGRPILLMELMDESLTKFLERSTSALAYHLQVNISYDIALALAYLHSNEVIHRDLSSNNVLIMAGSRAKVTDFGMLKLLGQDMHTTPLTKCPGTEAYMPPEALADAPKYTDRLDCFSYGVLMLQIITRNYPRPTQATITVHDPKYPTGRVLIPVPETERRKKDIELVGTDNPLRPILLECIKDADEKRPSASDICASLSSLKGGNDYTASIQRRTLGDDAEISSLREELDQLKTENAKMSVLSKDKDRKLDELKQQVESLKAKINNDNSGASDSNVATERRWLLHDDFKKVELSRTRTQANEMSQSTSQDNPPSPWRLNWDSETKVSAKRAMWRGAATSAGSLAFFNPGLTGIIYTYDSIQRQWSELPHCPHVGFTLVTVDNLITAVGGNKELYTPGNSLLSFRNRNWEQVFPPMITQRCFAASVCSGQHLIVAGGCGQDSPALNKVEVMDTNTRQWTVTISLPVGGPLPASMAVCQGSVYYFGVDTNRAYGCSLNELLPPCSQEHEEGANSSATLWKSIADLPVSRSTAVTLCDRLVSVGGYDDSGEVDSVYYYHSQTNIWIQAGKLLSRKGLPLATTLPGEKLVVVHGNHGNTIVGAASVVSV